ncbi:Major facilitator superfamily domain-containing protein 6-A [Halotydeus destructor]|nr:Major facilitator superfamily domain-containing protein 6-A [Halotydeus destructor]
MRQLGLSVEETALIYTLLPFTNIIGPPIAGFAADKLGKYKSVLLMSLFLVIASATGILFVPPSPAAYLDQPTSANSTTEGDRAADILSPDHQFTFWSYFMLRILFSTFSNICFTLVEATSVVMVEMHKSDYGRQRLWAMLASGLSSPVCGLLIDVFSEDSATEMGTNYDPAFYAFNLLVFLTIVFTFILDLEVVPPPPDVFKHMKPLLKSLDIWVFLAIVLVSGTLWGFVENFLFWYLKDLKAPNYLLGLTLTTGCIVGLPFLHSSEWILEKAGRVNLLILAQVFYMIRFVGYSYIENPWFCIPFEALEAFTLHLMWVSAVTYAVSLTPPGLTATIQGTVGSIHYGIGRGLGSFIGGSLMAGFGARLAFRFMGYGAAVSGIVFSLYYYVSCCRKPRTLATNGKPEAAERQLCQQEKEPPLELQECFEMGEDDEHHARRIRKDSVLSITSVNRHNPKP